MCDQSLCSRSDQLSSEPATSKTEESIFLLLHTREEQIFVASGYDALARTRVTSETKTPRMNQPKISQS
jgi:hypothetical protein